MMTAIKFLAGAACMALLAILATRAIFDLPPQEGRLDSAALPAPQDSLLARAIQPQQAAHPGKTGALPLASGADAFAARMLLADAAQSSVDARYYIRQGDLLNAGTRLFELKQQAAGPAPHSAGPFGSPAASLHAKTSAVDGQRICIGSFNFDPHSTMLNSEMGLLIDSPRMARRVHDAFDRRLDGLGWEVSHEGGDLVWTDQEDGRMLHSEPGTSPARRIALKVIGRLPVEWIL